MRTLALVGLVAACGSEPGLLLDVHASGNGVVQVEVFLPDGTAGDAMGMPPGGSNASAKTPGTIYTVIDRVSAKATGGTATILLKPGDLSAVPALLVLGYDANHTAIAYAVITDPSGSVKLPASRTVELKVALDPVGNGVKIARWSSDAPTGDPMGPCIGVVGGSANAFFSVAGDLDCDAEQPDCDDTAFKYIGTTPPASALCASDSLYPPTMDACTIGSSLACTDGIGTCGPRVLGDTPVCVPATVCKHCPNSDATTGTSGINASCELAARTDQDTIRIDCQLLAMAGSAAGTVSPCTDPGKPLDLAPFVGAGWGCLPGSMYWVSSFGGVSGTTPGGFLPVGGTAGSPDYRVDAHCGNGSLAFSFTGTSTTTFPDEPMTDVVALFAFGMHAPAATTAFAQIALPFRLSYTMTDMCPPLDQPAITCEIKAQSGNPMDDPLWKGCAGAL